jgi:hypothetical protein
VRKNVPVIWRKSVQACIRQKNKMSCGASARTITSQYLLAAGGATYWHTQQG